MTSELMVDNYSQSIELKNKLSENQSFNKHVISMLDISINNTQCFIAIDSLGYLNLWIFREEFFSSDNEENIANLNIIPCDICFEIYRKDSNFRLRDFSQLGKINDYLVLSGAFDTIFIKYQQIYDFLQKLPIDSISSKIRLSNISHVKIEKLVSDFYIPDFSPFNSTVNGFHTEANKLLSYNCTGFMSIFDMQSMSLLHTINLDDHIQLKFLDQADSILTGKIVSKQNKIIIGTDEGNLNIFDLNNFHHFGFFNIPTNKFYSSESDYDDFSDPYVKNQEALTCLDITNNGTIVNVFNNFRLLQAKAFVSNII